MRVIQIVHHDLVTTTSLVGNLLALLASLTLTSGHLHSNMLYGMSDSTPQRNNHSSQF